MAAKIKVSYIEPEELQEIVKRLQPVKRVYISKKEHEGYKKAYIELKK